VWLASRVCRRRASDSSSGWLDEHYSSVSSRHQLSWSCQVDVSPQPRRTPLHSTVTVDEASTRQSGDRHYGCVRQLGMTRQPLTQPSSLSALVECVYHYFQRRDHDVLIGTNSYVFFVFTAKIIRRLLEYMVHVLCRKLTLMSIWKFKKYLRVPLCGAI